MTQKNIPTRDLIDMNAYAGEYNYRVDLAYALDDNLLFGERVYKLDARLWLHKDLARIVFLASKLCFDRHDVCFILYDGLRTVEAQSAMMRTRRVLDNPQWLEPPRLLSVSGAGGHPRAMAIDIGLEDLNGKRLDMGSEFDFLAKNAHPDHNQAHRDYKHSDVVMKNRAILDKSMGDGAARLSMPLFPLPQEWWDFRFPPEIYEAYTPISEADLPDDVRLIGV